MIDVDTGSFLLVVAASALAPAGIVVSLVYMGSAMTIAIDAGEMRSSTAAGLVGAAMLSTLIFPFAGLALRRGEPKGEPD